MNQARAALALALSAVLLAAAASSAEPASSEMVLFADRDDDDANGVADAEQEVLTGRALDDVVTFEAPPGAYVPQADLRIVRLLHGSHPLARGQRLPRQVGVQGLAAGEATLELGTLRLKLRVVEFSALDGMGEQVDLARSHASITRILPIGLSTEGMEDERERDALRWLAVGPRQALPSEIEIVSTQPDGAPLDRIPSVALESVPCPAGIAADLTCRLSALVRATSDVIDRSHPQAFGHSLRAEVGGVLSVRVAGREAASIRVGGPRHTRLGPLSRFRGRLRVRLVRLAPGGSVPIGGSEAGALELAREEVHTASSLWGQCGIHFGYGEDLDIAVVDPPPAHMLAVGCDFGLPASGGDIAFVAAGKRISVRTELGQTPTQVAGLIAQAVRRAGLRALISPNARIGPGALRTVDVLVRRPDGALVALQSAPDRSDPRLSTDATLNVCLGELDLADGLAHFSDFDAIAGTVEERTLIKAFDDGDPATIEVFIIPAFARSARIGESFIFADGSSVRNTVILDRAGIRAGARSFALAHELGHILLDMPGHPDDFGVDRPSSLMDADAADPTIFGPRRLTIAECERAILQSGPTAPVPLLEPWPLYRRSE